MRITKVEITNFQSHAKTIVELDKDFNIFVGSSNSGKSSFLRAIRWCMTNKPSGNDFIKIGEKSAKVVVHLDNGYTIERERGKGASLNYYRLLKDDVLISEYTGFGTGVPSEVEEIVGSIDEWEYTFADQLEAPYLISETPRARAERIGNLENFAKLDYVIGDLKTEERDVKKEERESKKKLSEFQKEYQEIKMEHNKIEPLYNMVESAYEDILKKEQKKEILENLKVQLKDVQKTIPELSDKVMASTVAVAVFKGLDDKVEKFRLMNGYKNRIENIQQELNSIHIRSDEVIDEINQLTIEVEKKIEQFQKVMRINKTYQNNQEQISLIPTVSDIAEQIRLDPIEKKIQDLKTLNRMTTNYVENIKTQQEIKNSIENTHTNIESLLNDFVEEIQSAEICPTCTQSTSDVDINTIKNNL